MSNGSKIRFVWFEIFSRSRIQDHRLRKVGSVSRLFGERLARARKHIESTAGSGNPLSAEPALRRHLSLGGRDTSPIRLHTGAEAQRIAALLGADAVTSGTDIFFAADRFDPRTDAGLRLIEHEFAHVGQQSQRDGPLNRLAARGGSYCGTAGDPWERMASAGVPGGNAASAFRAAPPRPGAIIQCHDSFEHRVLGDLRTADFTAPEGPAAPGRDPASARSAVEVASEPDERHREDGGRPLPVDQDTAAPGERPSRHLR